MASISIPPLEIFQVELLLKFYEKEELNVTHDCRRPWGLKVSARDETAPAGWTGNVMQRRAILSHHYAFYHYNHYYLEVWDFF